MAWNSAARKPIWEVFMRRAAEGKLKWTGTQFPCQASAQDAEMSLGEYEDFVFGADQHDGAGHGAVIDEGLEFGGESGGRGRGSLSHDAKG